MDGITDSQPFAESTGGSQPIAGSGCLETTSFTKAKRTGKLREDLPSPLDPPDLGLPDTSDYVALKLKLQAILPRDVLRDSEEEVRSTMKGVEQYAKERGVVPDNGWRGMQRMQEHKSLLDFVKIQTLP